MSYRKTAIESTSNVHPFDGGLKHGTIIIVSGKVPDDPDGFSFSLQNEQTERCDIAFYFNPRPVDRSVVRNSRSGDWGTEEQEIPYFPFQEGTPFTIECFVGPDSYIVLVKGQYFIEHKHRLPYQKVHYLKVSEGLEVTITSPHYKYVKE